MLFGEDVPLCQCDVFSSCLTARLCAVSQDRQTDRQDISDVFTICSGRTGMMGRDEKERHLFSQCMKRWMVSEDLLPDIYCYQLSQRSGKRRAPCGTLSTLTWNKGQRWSVMLSYLKKTQLGYCGPKRCKGNNQIWKSWKGFSLVEKFSTQCFCCYL